MNNSVIIAFISISCILTSQAQGLYFGLKAGYGIGLANQQLATTQTYSSGIPDANGGSDVTSSSKSVNGSYGEGFTSSLQIGYMFSKYIGAEIGASYLIGKKFERLYNTTGYNFDGGLSSTTSSTKTGATSFYINPSLVFRLHNESKFIPYAKMGLYIGLINKLSTDFKMTDNTPTTPPPSNSTSKYSNESIGNINLGLTATFGLDYMITKNISLFGEFNIIASSLSLKNNKVVNSYVQTSGNNKYSTSYTYETNYSDEITSSYHSSNTNNDNSTTTPITGPGVESGNTTVHTNDNGGQIITDTEIHYTNGDYSYTSNSVAKSLSPSVPLSSIGIAIGVRYYFGK